MIDGDKSSRRIMKSMQNENVTKTNENVAKTNENVAKTSGENKNFEGRMIAKSEIVKKTNEIYSIFDSHKSACAPNHRKRNASATVQN